MAEPRDIHIRVRGLSRTFASPDGSALEVLKELSFEVDRGGFVSVVGPSGCGKSTLLNLIAGLDEKSSGDVQIDEEAPAPRLGFVFQQPRLLPWRTVLANVELPLESAGTCQTERRARAREQLSLVGLTGFEDYHPGQISGGMQQRAALARALVVEPGILLMDEPFSSLDAITAQRLREELIRIWRETKKTVLFVTHDLAEAVFLSERVLLVTPKPARLFRSVSIELPYPRRLEDERLFHYDRELRRELHAMGAP